MKSQLISDVHKESRRDTCNVKDTGNVLAIAEKGTSTLLMFILNMTPTVVKR